MCTLIHTASILVTRLAAIRKIIRDRDEKLNRAAPLSESQKKLVAKGKKIYADFQSIHLIGLYRDENDDCDEMKLFERAPENILNSLDAHNDDIHRPVSLQMLHEFFQLNRHFFIDKKRGKFIFNDEHGGKSPDDYPPFEVEELISSMNSDIIIYEFDDDDAEFELLYSIIINR